ncbi:UNVERIFIED_ORG: hypothetical protein DFS12_11056 [Chitinophaga ginsengisegetis]
MNVLPTKVVAEYFIGPEGLRGLQAFFIGRLNTAEAAAGYCFHGVRGFPHYPISTVTSSVRGKLWQRSTIPSSTSCCLSA